MRLWQKNRPRRKYCAILLVIASLLVAALDQTEEFKPLQTQQTVEHRVSTLPSPSSNNMDAVTPTPPTPPPIQEVFVPLQKWKEQKLQDIESRVKRDEAVLKKRMKHTSEKGGYVGKILSRRQILFRQLFSRTCGVFDEMDTNQTIGNGHLSSLEYPVVTPVAVVQSTNSRVPLIESPEIPVVSVVEDVPVVEKDIVSISNDKNFEPAPSVVIETPIIVQHSLDATAPGTSPEVVSNQPVTTNFVMSPTEVQSHTPSLADIDVDTAIEDTAPTPLLKKIERKVRSIRDTVTTAVNLSQNAAKVRNLRDSVATFVNVSQNDEECTNVSNKVVKNEASVPPEKFKPMTTPDMQFVTDQLRKGSGSADDLVDAAKAPVKVKRTLFNFASEGAGAQILASSPNTVGAKNIITENSDKYMLVPCVGDGVGGSRWVDIELSEYAFLTSVQTANFEHYSSTARKFAVLGAENYPPRQWNVLGVFDFKDTRAVQTFVITGTSRKVTRFLRVVYAGRHGHEYYCPISIFRAFGKNLIADLKDGLETPMDEPSHNSAPKETEVKIKGPASDNVLKKDENKKDDKKEVDNPPLQTNNDVELKDSGNDAGKPQQSRNKETSGADVTSPKKGNGELSADDQILLNVIREETLSPVSGDDNIFRRVARMIRLLELNQSLTNQYIDTHLARFAVALSTTQSEADRSKKAADLAQARAAGVSAQLERALEDMHAATLRRDMLMCALMVCIGFLLGTHWVMWTALSVRAARNLEDVTSPVSSPEGSAVASKEEKTTTTTSKGRIVETVSVDGVHVHMTDVRPRRRRKRRGDAQNLSGAALNSPQSFRSASGRVGLPPIGVSPSKMKPLFTSNSFQPLCSTSEAERENFAHSPPAAQDD